MTRLGWVTAQDIVDMNIGFNYQSALQIVKDIRKQMEQEKAYIPKRTKSYVVPLKRVMKLLEL